MSCAFALKLPQVRFALKRLGVDFVNLFGARRPRGKPTRLGDDFEATDGSVVRRSAGQFWQ